MSPCNKPPVRISGSFLLLAAWFAMECGWRPLLLVLAAAALHEMGHLLALRLCGAPVRGMRISALGAVMDVGWERLGYGQELLAVLAGPLANLLWALLLLLPARETPWLYAAIGAHLVLGAFNLLPIRPLDGGQALELLASWRLDPERGERIARLSGVICAGALSVGLIWLMHTSGGNLWLLPPAVGLLAAGGREALGRRGEG